MPRKSVKCVVWDLDNTLWEGTLLEGDAVRLRPGVLDVLKTLDARGILLSIASRNEAAVARQQLERFELNEYFLYPQINWGSKAASIAAIAEALNLSVDTFAFVDDSPFERDEVAHALPDVLCLDAARLDEIPALPELTPKRITPDAAKRRHLYRRDLERKEAEGAFVGPRDEFLATLGLKFSIGQAREGDLERVEELTVRTSQLNATGRVYGFDDLEALRSSPDHALLIAALDDRYGSYGKIGVALVEKRPGRWTIKLLVMSCRVIPCGVGAVLLTYIMKQARDAGARLFAEFVPTDRNRIMKITYRLGGFQPAGQKGEIELLEATKLAEVDYPAYLAPPAELD